VKFKNVNKLFVQRILYIRMMSSLAKLLIYKTIIRPVGTHAREAAVNMWEREIVRKIYGPINEGEQWRIRTNAELQ
jgi:hypothetical protein